MKRFVKIVDRTSPRVRLVTLDNSNPVENSEMRQRDASAAVCSFIIISVDDFALRIHARRAPHEYVLNPNILMLNVV